MNILSRFQDIRRSILCNCDIHAEEHSLLESIATCPGKQSDMTIYYTVNTAFMPYLDTFKEELVLPRLEINQNWTTQNRFFQFRYRQHLSIVNYLMLQKP